MKIAYVGSFTRIHDEQGIALSLEELGHEVLRFEESEVDLMTVPHIISAKPDFVLFAKLKFQWVLRNEFVSKLKEARIKTVCYMPDLYFGLGREYRVRTHDPIFEADYVFSPDGGHNARFARYQVNHHVLRQGIYDQETILGKPNKVPYEIVFIGSENMEFPYRNELCAFLSKTYGDNFQWIGKHNSNEIRGLSLNNLFASVKVVIGDSVYSPYYWSNRIYETLGRGGFLIHPKIEGLEQEFEYYKHVIPYDYGDFDGLKEKINFFLSHDKEREKIRLAGYEYCKKHYTLLERCKKLLEIIT